MWFAVIGLNLRSCCDPGQWHRTLFPQEADTKVLNYNGRRPCVMQQDRQANANQLWSKGSRERMRLECLEASSSCVKPPKRCHSEEECADRDDTS